jgi:PAS domain-containing protein
LIPGASWTRVLRVAGDDFVSAHALVQSTLLGELLERARIGAVAIDEGRTYVAANEHACSLLGFERGELIGRQIGERSPFSDEQGRVELTRKDGTPLAVGYRVAQSSLAGMSVAVALFWPAV